MADEILVFENAGIIFRNFSGQASQFNPEGKRNFCVLLELEQARELKEKGWNVRWLEGRAEGEEAQGYMQVAVSFDNYPPTVMMVTSKNKTMLKAENIGMLDWAEIKSADLTIRPYTWEVNGNTGIKAYLKSLYVTIEEDALAEKYSEIPF